MTDKARVTARAGSMWRLFGPDHAKALSREVQIVDGHLHIYLRSLSSLHSIERALGEAARTEGVSRSLSRLVLALPALIFGVIAMALVAVTGMFGDQLKDFLSDGALPAQRALIWGAISLAFGALVIGYAPSLLSPSAGEKENHFVRVLKQWLNPGQQSVARVARTIRALKRRNRRFTVTIWNPIGRDRAWVRTALIAPCLHHGIDLELVIHRDEADEVRSFIGAPDPLASAPPRVLAALRQASEHIEIVTDGEVDDLGDGARPSIAHTRAALNHVLAANEMALLTLLLACSTCCFSTPWKAGLARSRLSRTQVVATALAEHVLTRFRVHFVGDERSASIGLQTFLQRCLRDYLLLERFPGARDFTIPPGAPWPAELVDDDRTWIAERLIDEDQRTVLENVSDPTALFILLGRHKERDPGSVTQNHLLARFAALALRYEAFGYAAVVSDVLLDPPGDQTGDGGAWTHRFYGLTLDALRDWDAILQPAGKFETALKFAGKLKSVARLDYTVDEARLLERTGRAREGIVALESEYAVFKDFPGPGYAKRIDPQEHSARFLQLALRYHLQCSWIILSGRLDEPGRREQARNALDQAGELLGNPWFDGVAADDRWRYFNYEANFCEWVGNLQGARDMHLKALSVPGTSLKWLSGSEVNIGIVYRKLYEMGKDKADIERAIHHGARACEIKEAMGDHDELPVALHNLAWTKVIAAEAESAPQKMLADTIEVVGRAIDIIDTARSKKKRPQLYAERFAAHYLLSRHGGSAADALTSLDAFCAYAEAETPDGDIADGKAIVAQFTGGQNLADVRAALASAPPLAPAVKKDEPVETVSGKKGGWPFR